MRKPTDSVKRLKKRNLHAQAIRMWEIFLAYFGIFLIESACLFPAVWVR
jgi:hypothetical protein